MNKHVSTRRAFVKNIAAVSAATTVSPLFADVDAMGFSKQTSSVAGKSLTSGQKPVLNRVADTRYDLQGIMKEYIRAITANWLLRVPDANPALLQMFADRDKKPHRDLLPWSGEFAGKYLTGATQILRVTHDPVLKNYLSTFVSNLVQLQTEDGYLGPASNNQRLTWGWDVWGHYHTMLGLLFWYEDTDDKAALQCAVKIGDLLCRKVFKTGQQIVDAGSVEMNHAAIHSLCLLYKITKTSSYLELAHQIADVEFQDNRAGDFIRLALAGKEFYEVNKPRWESLHSLQGILELYLITGNDDYRKAFEHLWWSIVKLDRHNNGGFSSGEKAQGNPYHQGAIETCCTIAWMAMGIDMLRLTGNSIVADELELSTLNQVLGYQHRSGKWCTYNTPMDGTRRNSTTDIAFQIRPGSEDLNCCSANAARGFGMISDWALMTDEQGLILNWYGPSAISTNFNGKKISITQETEYPQNGQIKLTVSPERDLQCPLKLRIPNWSAKTRVEVNGKPVADVKSGTYLVLDRKWKSGDKVQIDLDMLLHYWVGERECEGKTSIYRGPLLLVYQVPKDEGKGVPEFDATMINSNIIPYTGMLPPPVLLMEFSDSSGKKVLLQDYGTAGYAGATYCSWLKVQNVKPEPFSEANPLRSSRLLK